MNKEFLFLKIRVISLYMSQCLPDYRFGYVSIWEKCTNNCKLCSGTTDNSLIQNK